MKAYADSKASAKSSEISVGEVVLFRQDKKNKLTMKLNPSPCKVISRNGSRVTVLRNGKYITRNISFFKKISCTNLQTNTNVSDEDYYGDVDENDHQRTIPETEPRYPTRERQPVQR